MGHAHNGTVQKYLSDVVSVDDQAPVAGKKQRTQLSKNQSISIQMKVQAPQPPGSCLKDVWPFIKEPELGGDDLKLEQLPPAKRSELRRQTQERMFFKNPKELFENIKGLFQEIDPHQPHILRT